MPTTWRETALAAAFVKLQAISGISGLTMARNRVDAVEDFPMVVQRDGSQELLEGPVGADYWAIAVEVELFARPAAGTDLGTSIDVLYGAVKAALLADTTLGGAATDVRETSFTGPLPDFTDSATAQAGATVGFEIRVWAKTDDPYNLGP
jgi:hypothetical protein